MSTYLTLQNSFIQILMRREEKLVEIMSRVIKILKST